MSSSTPGDAVAGVAERAREVQLRLVQQVALEPALEQPTAGRVAVPGHKPSLMFQEPALYPWLTAAENIGLALKLRGVDKGERKDQIERLLSLVRLDGAGAKRPHEPS